MSRYKYTVRQTTISGFLCYQWTVIENLENNQEMLVARGNHGVKIGAKRMAEIWIAQKEKKDRA